MPPPHSLANLDDHLSRLLGGPCKLYTTRCVGHELRAMGPDTAAAADAARGYALHHCGHEGEPMSAADCLLAQVGLGSGGSSRRAQCLLMRMRDGACSGLAHAHVW